MPSYSHALVCVLLTTLALQTACATTSTSPSSTAKLPAGIYNVQTGKRVTYDALIERTKTARYVIVGEMHTDAWHHQIQQRILTSLSAINPSVGLGMEMFQRPFQSHLDDFVAGRITEPQMLERTEYAKRWGFNTTLYAPLWRTAKKSNLAIIALNAPKAWTRTTAKVGVAQLPPEIKTKLPELDLSSQAHRTWMKEMFQAHGATMKDRTFERFYEAQVIWDETMADSAVRALKRDDISQMLIVAGSGHVLNRYGIPSRIERRLGPNTRKNVITIIPQTRKAPLTSQQLTTYAKSDFADFIWVSYATPTRPSSSPH